MKQFMPELSQQERLRALKDHCDSVEERTYFRSLTQNELDIKREQFVENAIEISKLEDSLNEIKKSVKAQMDPIKDVNKGLQQELKTRQQEVRGNLFHLADHENKMMEVYDEAGYLVSSRRLRPEENQTKLFIAATPGKTAEQ
jgi:hypothetical protein